MGSNRRVNVLNLRDQPKLITAIIREDRHLVGHLIGNGSDVNECDVERRSPLHLCSSVGNTAIAQMLVNAGARVNARDNQLVSPLHRACRDNHELVVTILLENGADANTRDRQWITPMHVCAANNALECARVLLPKVGSIDASDRLGATPLHHAVFNSHLDLITFLLSHKAQANAFDKCDRRPIHYAASVDSTDAIRFLVETGGAEVNVHDRDLMTPLHMAAAKGSLNALHLLLDFGAKMDAIDVFGNTALHWAALYGQDDIIDELILRGAPLGAVNRNGVTALHLAASSPMSATALDVLLTHKETIDVNARDKYGRTALHFAAKHGRHQRIPDLIRCGANSSIADKGLATPLHYACGKGHTPAVDALLQSVAERDVNLIDTNGMSALHYASFAGMSSASRRLLESNANSQICDTSGRTAHFMASYSGNIECLEMLLPLPAKPTDAFNRSLLHYASSGQSSECLNFLLKNFNDKFDINQQDMSGLTALHCAASHDEDDNRCVDLLLEFGAKPDICDNNGFYALHYAAATGMTSAVHSLLAAHDWKTIQMRVCPTHCAAFYGKQESLQLLLQNGFTDIGTALEFAILKDHNICVKIILDFLRTVSDLRAGSHIVAQSLLLAAQYALQSSLRVILNYTLCPDVTDHRGRTPLMLAALHESGADCLEMLLQRNANPNALDSQKRSALFYAVYSGCEDSVKKLLNFGALPQIRCLNGKTVYHLAAALGHSDVLLTLFNFNPNNSVETLADREGLTPIHWAALKSQANCMTVLLDYEPSKKVYGNRISPLHMSARSSSADCFELLISHFGIESMNLVDDKKRTVLHFACLANTKNMRIIDTLIANGLDVNCEDSAGQTPLMYAAKRGNIKIVEQLLSNGASVQAVDEKRNTALHWCCLNGHEDCGLRVLKECHSLVSATNADLKTPLHMSGANGLVRLTQELLLAGASVQANDADGLTPSLCCAKSNEVADCLMLIESIMLSEAEPRKSLCDTESASTGESKGQAVGQSLGQSLRQSIIRRSAQIYCDITTTPNASLNNISDHQNSSDSDFY